MQYLQVLELVPALQSQDQNPYIEQGRSRSREYGLRRFKIGTRTGIDVERIFFYPDPSILEDADNARS